VTEPLGLSKKQISEIKMILKESLVVKTNIKVFVFGSRATNKFKKYSDLDLWIETEPELSQSEIGQILEKFEESNLSITIDIVSPITCLPEYQAHILKEKKLWF
jgi:predicted nucleotidyltransferase